MHWNSTPQNPAGHSVLDDFAAPGSDREKLCTKADDETMDSAAGHVRMPRKALNPVLDPLLNAVHGHFAELTENNLRMERTILAHLQGMEKQLMSAMSSASGANASNRSGRRGAFDKQRVEDAKKNEPEASAVEPSVAHRMCDVSLPETAQGIGHGSRESASRQTISRMPMGSNAEFQFRRCHQGREDKPCEDTDAEEPEPGTQHLNWQVALALEVLPALVIAINALVIGISTDVDPKSDVWLGFEIFFTSFFFGEILVKLRLTGVHFFFCGPTIAWNLFDVFCATVAIFDISITLSAKIMGSGGTDLSGLMMMKMIRLAKLLRLVRLMRFHIFTELKNIITGLFSGLRVLFWAQVLLLTVIYLGGIIATNIVGDSYPEFSSLPASMFTLFRCFTDGCSAYDGTPLQERLRSEYGAVVFVAWIVSYLFVTIGIFNLIMAIFIEHVLEAQVMRRKIELGESAGMVYNQIQEVMMDLAEMSHCDLGNGREDASAATAHNRAAVRERNSKSQRSSVKGILETRLSRALGVDQEHPPVQAQFAEEKITRDVFNSWLCDKRLQRVLEDADVDLASKHEIFDVLDSDLNGILTTNELIHGMMRLRGPIRKTEIVAIRLKMRLVTERMQIMMASLEQLHAKDI